MAITQDEVFSVVATLIEEGKDPSVRTVRERLGTGSYSTIARYLREWAIAQRDQAVVREDDIPPEIRSAATHFTSVVWRSASDWLMRELALAKKVSGERIQAAEAEAQAALDEVERLEKELAEAEAQSKELQSRCEELVAQNTSFNSAINEIRAQLERERTRLTTVEERNHTLADRVAEEARSAATAEERAKQHEERSQKLEVELQESKRAFEQLRDAKEIRIKELEDDVRSLRAHHATQTQK